MMITDDMVSLMMAINNNKKIYMVLTCHIYQITDNFKQINVPDICGLKQG